jgi:hypothetical protein
MSDAKHQAALRNLEAAAIANAVRREALGLWHCAQCGKAAPATVHQLRQTYCSKACMATGYAVRMRGEANPNFRAASVRTCVRCGAQYHSYNKERKYCAHACYAKEVNEAMRTNAKKDANHGVLSDALNAAGATVMDLSRAMYGVPDIAIWWDDAWHLAEIKNPKTTYGRRGLNHRQASFARDWRGGPVHVLRTLDDVKTFLHGDRKSLEHKA